MDNKRICRRCLIGDIPEAEEREAVEALIASIPPKDRTDELIYNARLNACRSCSHLMRGTCRKCGCYVEIRAAGKKGYCPDVPDRWQIQET